MFGDLRLDIANRFNRMQFFGDTHVGETQNDFSAEYTTFRAGFWRSKFCLVIP